MQVLSVLGQQWVWICVHTLFRKTRWCSLRSVPTRERMWQSPWLTWPGKIKTIWYTVHWGCIVIRSRCQAFFPPLCLLRVLMEQEDRVRDTTVILSTQPVKKKACCKWRLKLTQRKPKTIGKKNLYCYTQFIERQIFFFSVEIKMFEDKTEKSNGL